MTLASELERKTPDQWLNHPDFKGIIVMDPDGWDRKDFDRSWADPITRYEFEVRLGLSTCAFPAGYFKVGRE